MSVLTLPGLIDPHVHLRTPGQEYKEDFLTGTQAAVAGGFTTIVDMPNNKTPITTLARLEEKIAIAEKQTVCNLGFHFGSLGDNISEFDSVKNKVVGLKLYLNETTGNFLIDPGKLEEIFEAWNGGTILLHAEDDALPAVIQVVKKTGKRAHFCHISTASDLKQIMSAKETGLPISCGVTPHHLFLTENDGKILGPFGKMKPPLRKQKDVDFLWKNIKAVDIIESDHAPHTLEEKTIVRGEERVARAGDPHRVPAAKARTSDGGSERQDPPSPQSIPYGVPGLETALPLLLTAVSQNRLEIEDVVRLCHDNPAQIFGIEQGREPASPGQGGTKIEIDLNQAYTIEGKNLFTKCRWSPFEGWKMKGKLIRAIINNKTVFENEKITIQPGEGKII